MSNNKIWCEKLLLFWKQKEIENIVNLFDENIVYYEEPSNTIAYKDLVSIWSEIKEHDTSNLKYNILVEENNKCIANFILKGKTTIDMIYEIELNSKNKCIYFKQWYMEY